MRRFAFLTLILITVLLISVPGIQAQDSSGERTHLVLDGENLYTIAARYGVTVVSIAQLNGITDFNYIEVGRRLRIPPASGSGSGSGDSSGRSAPEITPFPPALNQATAPGFGYGIEIHLPGQDVSTVIAQLQELGVGWVSQRIEWKNYETTRGEIAFDQLDAMLNPLHDAGFQILLTVTSAPDWARSTSVENGPPNVYADYAVFMGALANHYSGVVNAYEIWDEPNLRREWNGKAISGEEYVKLLRLAYNAIKEADPTVSVITAGLAPTETSDGQTAVNDRTFLRQMYAAGVADYSDAIGAHPFGWANPPDSVCCETLRPAVPSWDDQEAFFFLETLQDYRAIMLRNDEGNTFIWITSFGWGSSEGLSARVPEDYEYVIYTDLLEQAQYTLRAFQLGRDLTYVGPMFTWNLNFCQAMGDTHIGCYWSLLNADGTSRPAYDAIKSLSGGQ